MTEATDLRLGIIRDGDGDGARLLADAGVDLRELRTRTVDALNEAAA